MRPVLFLSHQASAGPGILADALESAGVPFAVARTWELAPPPSLDGVSALVVLGGEQNADDTSSHPYLATNRAILGEAVARDIPVLGVCLGAQILARALGGRVTPAAVRDIGWQPIEVLPEGRMDPVAGAFASCERLFQWHEDCFEVPSGSVLLARNAVGPQAFRFGRRAYGVQFHLEVTEETIAQWIKETDPATLRGMWGSSSEELVDGTARYLTAQAEAARGALNGFLSLTEERVS
ncbi:type 1 glutamine amidotransferase [soil metagenome]